MTTFSTLPPTRGPEYDPSRPETKQAWLEFRRQGLTATEVRDWRKGGTDRRRVLDAKTHNVEVPDNAAFRHGRVREPIIAEWVQGMYGIHPDNHVYARGDDPRWLASPDGILVEPFTGETWLCEIKTSRHDLTPGKIVDGALVQVAGGSMFHRSGYYTQMQAQMLVMNATRCLFVWEQHDGTLDPETGVYAPTSEPRAAWVERDEEHIRELIDFVYGPALAQIDQARVAVAAGEPVPTVGIPDEQAALIAELFAAREAEAAARRAREAAWEALQGVFTGEGAPDVSLVVPGFASVTVNNIESSRTVVDEDGMRAKAPALVARYEALRERFTSVVRVPKQTFTVTPNK